MKALPKDLRYLLFDLDGTLTDSAEGILRCVQYALEQCGTPEPDAEKLRPFIGPPLLDSFQEFCGMPPARAAFAVEQYRKRFSTVGLLENAVYDGIPELLEKLAANGQIATQYVDLNGVPGMDVDVNPNGSAWAVEGITSPDGRVLGKMGHSERIADGIYRNVSGVYDMKLFASAKKYFD